MRKRKRATTRSSSVRERESAHLSCAKWDCLTESESVCIPSAALPHYLGTLPTPTTFQTAKTHTPFASSNFETMFFTRSLASAAGGGGKSRTTVQLFYDIISPYTYIQFELLTRQKGQWPSMSLQFTPVAIGPLMTGAGNAPPMMVPAKGVYMLSDLARLTDFHKVI